MKRWTDKNDFKEAVRSWAEKLDVRVVSIYVRPMKNKWASCSTNGYLNFNDELINMDKMLGEYVIVHELLHIRIPNHGPLWKSYMNIYIPDWENTDRKLKSITEKERNL